MLSGVWSSDRFPSSGVNASGLSAPALFTRNDSAQAASRAIWYGGVACGVLATAAISAILWKRRLRALDLQVSPLERAEQLIESCESKLESIENAVAELKASP